MKHAVHVDHVFGKLQLTGIQAGEIENVAETYPDVVEELSDAVRRRAGGGIPYYES